MEVRVSAVRLCLSALPSVPEPQPHVSGSDDSSAARKRGSEIDARVRLQAGRQAREGKLAVHPDRHPRLEAVAARHRDKFPNVALFTIDEAFGGWQKAQKTHFGDGGIFDQIYRPGQ